jgi:predicted PurR-regulated permease PerM
MIGWRILLWAVLVLTALLFLYLVRGILPPFIIAFVLASLLEPLIRKLRLRGLKRGYAIGIVFFAFFLVSGVIALITVPRITEQIGQLNSTINSLTAQLEQVDNSDNFFLRWRPPVQARHGTQAPNKIDRILSPYHGTLERFGLPSTRADIMRDYVTPNSATIANLLNKGVNSFLGILTALPSYLLYMVLVPILLIFMLIDMEDFKRRAPKYIPPALRASTMRLFEDIGDVFIKYLRGVAMVWVLYMVLAGLLFLAMGVPYAILVAIIFSALYLIPYIGNIVAYGILFLLIGLSGATGYFWHFPSPWGYAVLVTVMYAAMALTFDQVIYPQLVGGSVGLNRVVSVFVILCGGALFGLPGMILAFPFAGSVKVILDRLLKLTSTSTEELNLPVVPLRHRATVNP